MTFSTPINSPFFPGPMFKYLSMKKNYHECEQTNFELKKTEKYKLIVYSPECLSDNVRTFLAESGAGVIGDYTHCSFTTKVSTYCHTFLYQSSSRDIERIETVVIKNNLPTMIKRINQNKELKYDIIPLYTIETKLPEKISHTQMFKHFQNIISLFKKRTDETFKLVVYAPESSAKKIKNFIEYNEMLYSSFSNYGTGRWCKTKSNGEKDCVDSAREERIEMTVKKTNLMYVISRLRHFHEYEEMGFDIIKPKSPFTDPLRTFYLWKKKMTSLVHSILPRIITPTLYVPNLEKNHPSTNVCKLEKSSNVQLTIYTPKSNAHAIRRMITPEFAMHSVSIDGKGYSHLQANKKASDFPSSIKNPLDKEKIEIVINEKLYPELINKIKLFDSENTQCDVLRLYDINEASVNFSKNTYSSHT